VGAVNATDTTGGVRGVVLDETVRPIKEATVKILDTGAATKTDATGAFIIDGLAAGGYILEVAHPLYATKQTATNVVAGVTDPDIVRVTLVRVILEDPYLLTIKYDGYIACSLNILVPGIGGILSEECGEGVGVPAEDPVLGTPIPVVGGSRVGGNPNNNAQIDFQVDGGLVGDIIVEQVWTPSLSVGVGAQAGGFNTVLATEFGCLPVCEWAVLLDRADGGSPLRLQADRAVLANITAETRISSFTWASAEDTGLLMEQPFEEFVSVAYYLPLPDGWSFVRGDPNPFI
jgi:hypothetical protein